VARGKKNADEALLLALACGATVEQAAQAAGLSARTAHRRLAEPGFQQRLEQLRAEMSQRTGGMLIAAGMEAVKTLLTLQGSTTPAAVRLGAARAILEFSMKLRESNELAVRVAALEFQVQSSPRETCGSLNTP
jgi:hypothetical protein